MLSSKPIPQCAAVRAEGGGLMTEESKVKARRAGYFELLYETDPPAVEWDVRCIAISIADPLINYAPYVSNRPSFVET